MTQVAEKHNRTDRPNQLFTLALSAWTALVLFRLISLLRYTGSYCDQSWYLYAAQRVLCGAQISGPQLVETNPPLAVWFSTIPVLFSRLLRLDPEMMLKLIVFAMIGGSVAWSGRILLKSGLVNSQFQLFAALGSVFSAEIFLNGWVFAEREHLLVILILPYVVSAICEGSSKLRLPERCAIGVAAGIAVCFKPQHALVLVALELFLAVWNRRLRRLASPDFLCAVLAVFVYVVLVRLAAPLYFSTTLPLLHDTYWAFGSMSARSLIRSERYFILFFLLALVAFSFTLRKLRFAIAPGAFLACSLASSIAFYVQHNGGANRAYPQVAFLLLAIYWIAIDLLSSTPAANWRFNVTFPVAALISALMLLPFLNAWAKIDLAGAPMEFLATRKSFTYTFFAHYLPNTPVFVFSVIPEAFPAVPRYHLIWASRFPCLWMLPAIVQNELAEIGGPNPRKVLSSGVVKNLAASQRLEMTEDIQRWKPSVVIVSQCHRSLSCLGLEDGFDFVAWFRKDPEFAGEWTNYRLETSQDGFDVYTRIPGETR